MTFIAAIADVNAAPVLRVTCQPGEIARWTRICRLEESVNIGKVRVRDSLRCEWRHFAGGLPNVSREIAKGPWRWGQCRAHSALAFGTVARGAHVGRQRIFSLLCVSCRRILWLRSLVLLRACSGGEQRGAENSGGNEGGERPQAPQECIIPAEVHMSPSLQFFAQDDDPDRIVIGVE